MPVAGALSIFCGNRDTPFSMMCVGGPTEHPTRVRYPGTWSRSRAKGWAYSR